MSLARGQIAAVRAWTGDKPSNEEIENRYDDLGTGSLLEVARQILQERLGDLTSGPASMNVQGDYAEDNKAVIEVLREQIAELSLLIDGQAIPGYDPSTSDTAEPASMTRDDRERLFTPPPPFPY